MKPMNALATVAPNPLYKTVVIEIAPQVHLPVVLRPVPTQAELTQQAKSNVLTVGLSGVAASGAFGVTYCAATVANFYGAPLVQNLATLNLADSATLLAAGGAAGAGAIAAFMAYRGVRHLIHGTKVALDLGKFALLPEQKTHEALEGSYAGLAVTARTLATGALATVGSGVAAAGLVVLQAPQSFYAYAAGAAALVASYFTGRSAVNNSVAWATNMLHAEVQTRISQALETAVSAGQIDPKLLEAPTPDVQPDARA